MGDSLEPKTALKGQASKFGLSAPLSESSPLASRFCLSLLIIFSLVAFFVLVGRTPVRDAALRAAQCDAHSVPQPLGSVLDERERA